MTSTAKSFHLRWNNHLTNLRSLLEALYNDQNLVDVTLSCRDGTIRAHKLMLSACSPYFETIFKSHEVEHPVVILKGISKKEMKCLIDYMYVGSLEVSEDELPSLLAVANELQIKGLIQKPNNVSSSSTNASNGSSITTNNHSSTSSSNHSNHTATNVTSNTSNSQTSSPGRSSSDPEDEDVEMEDRNKPVDVIPPPLSTPTEQTFRSVTQYGGGMVKPADVHPIEPAADDDRSQLYENNHLTIAPDGEVIEPLNAHNNNNNGQIKTSAQSSYLGHCLDEAFTHPDLQCRICKRYFNNRQNLRRHVQTHTGDKPHQCDICFISFLRLSHLQRHIRTHTGEKPYACSLCPKSFSRSDKLKNHYIHQHSEVGVELTNKKRGRPSKVNFPGFNFALSNNTLTIHNGQNENTSPPPSHLSQPSLEELARSQSLLFNSGALSLTPISLNSANNANNEALSLIVNKSLQNQAYQHIANAISENVLSIAPIKIENNVQEQTVS